MTSINILKKKVMNAHSELVRNGDFDVACSILCFLQNRQITLGLSDVGMKVEKILDDLGCLLRYTRRFYMVKVYLRPEEA